MRKKQHIEDFQDFVDLVDFSGKALVKEHDNFLQVPCGVSQAKYASKKPKLEATKCTWKKVLWMNFKVQNFYSESMLKV